MTGLQIGDEYLDLPTGLLLELVRNSPYLNNDEIQGEYTLPISIPYTDKNYRLLQYTGNNYKKHSKKNIDATLVSSAGIQYPGTLIIDGYNKNQNLAASVLSSGTFAFAISDFFQLVKDKKLTDLTLGGIRHFTWTTAAPFDGSGGFWQHVHDTIATPEDYTFFMIRNAGFGSIKTNGVIHIDLQMEWMNFCKNNGYGKLTVDPDKNVISLCPAISLKYVLIQLFAENGYTLKGDVLEDAGFKKLFIQSFNSIWWANYTSGGFFPEAIPLADIEVYLPEHMPPDYTITNFILDLKNRYGLAFIFDANSRTCTLKHLDTISSNGTTIDLTKYANSAITSKFDQAVKIASLINTPDEDDYPEIISNDGIITLPGVENYADLPAAAGVEEGTFCFVENENVYYECINDGSDKTWQLGADNVGDHINAGSTENVNTNITTFAMQRFSYRTADLFFHYIGNFPTCDQPGNWKQNKDQNAFGLRLLFHYGWLTDKRDDGSASGALEYPFASAINFTPYGVQFLPWANVYDYLRDGVNYGLAEIFWKNWLKLYVNTEIRTINISVPLWLLASIQWENVVVINQSQFLIKVMKYNVPYQGKVEMQLLKIF